MKITTYTGTVYELKDIEESESGYTAKASRVSDHAILSFSDPIENDAEFFGISFNEMPEVDYSFRYSHELWGHCSSSYVVEIEE